MAVFGDRQLTRTEVAVGVLELGYKSAMPKRDFVKKVARLLRSDDRFRKIGSRWTLA